MAMFDINDPRSLVGAQAAACTRSCSGRRSVSLP